MSRAATREKWVELLAEQSQSGQSKQAFCADRGLKVATFYYWQRRLSEPQAVSSASGFSQLRLPTRGSVIIHRPDGTHLELEGVEVDYVVRLLEALETRHA